MKQQSSSTNNRILVAQDSDTGFRHRIQYPEKEEGEREESSAG